MKHFLATLAAAALTALTVATIGAGPHPDAAHRPLAGDPVAPVSPDGPGPDGIAQVVVIARRTAGAGGGQ